jgi:hypothetical protein
MVKPWLDFANAALSLVRNVPFRAPRRAAREQEIVHALRAFLEQARETEAFPAARLREYLKPPPKWAALEAEAWTARCADLAINVAAVLDYYATAPPSVGDRPFFVVSRSVTGFETARGRALLTEVGDPFNEFVRVISGTETARIGECPICQRFFFKVRADRRACSRQCATTLRVRKHRQRQADYEQTRKEKPELVKSESKARRAKPRKEYRK